MTAHDIIDNRHERLVDHILAILPQAARARFAVGYFFLSGLEALGASLDAIGELRLLIGNTSNRETIEQLSEAYRRLDLVQERAEEMRLARRADHRARARETADNLRQTIGVMDQTDAGEELVHALIRMVEEQRLKVRVYTRGRLHAKAYIFDWTNPTPGNRGIAIVGSSNLTLAGVRDNTELNVLVHDNGNPLDPTQGNHAKLTAWFEELWDEAQDFDELLMTELRQSWAGRLATPYDVYMKTLYTLVRDRLDGDEERTLLGEDEITRSLADFQEVAVRQAIRMIREYGGCFVADVVGLGKSFVGAAIVKYFERAEGRRALIICPKALKEMWVEYNERFDLNAHVVPMSKLLEGDRGVDLLHDVQYRERDFVLIDESHNFRHSDTQRYRVLQEFIAANPERRVCLLTATPRNSRALDVYHQIKLFHHDEVPRMPIDAPTLRAFFNRIGDGPGADGTNTARLQDLLRHILIRRTRRSVLRWYGYADDTGQPLSALSESEAAAYLDGRDGRRAYIQVAGRRQYFPRRELETLRYSIEDTYNGLYETIRGYLGRPGRGREVAIAERAEAPAAELTYARYGLYNYVRPEKRDHAPYTDLQRAGRNLRGLIRTMLFKRFESSVAAFRQTLERMVETQTAFLAALDAGIVPAGEPAERLLGRADALGDDLVDALAAVSQSYRAEDFDVVRLRRHIQADIRLLRKMLDLVAPITPERDDKLRVLRHRLASPPTAGKKCLIFTQYADTAEYLYENLNPGGARADIEVIYGDDKNKSRIVARFAPRANPQLSLREGESEIQILIATDVLAEGLNMQDCDVVINYDLHWNPVRLIQRFGRIDRIGSEHAVIWGYNFLPERGIERNLRLTEVLRNRIQEIHETIGEDAAILDRSEQINPEAMYAIYEGNTSALSRYEDDPEEASYVDLNEAEEMFRRLRQDDPDEFRRIADLRDGIRAGMPSQEKGCFVFCQAGSFQQLVLVDEAGNEITRDIGRVLAAIRATPETPGLSRLPQGHNGRVMAVKRRFEQDVRYRRTQQEHTGSRSVAQDWVLRQLRELYAETSDEGLREKINMLERAFSIPPTAAVRRELGILRRDGITGLRLIDNLITIYHRHRLQDRLEQAQRPGGMPDIPHVVCSMALV